MIRLMLLVAALSMGGLVQDCDFDIENIDQFVINWSVNVTNQGNEPAAVTVQVQDKTRSATLKVGESLKVVSFKPGVWHVTIIGSTSRKAVLTERYQKMVKQLEGLDKKSAAYTDLDDDLDDVDEALEKVQDLPNTATCAGRMEHKGGDELEVSATQPGTRATDTYWSCGG